MSDTDHALGADRETLAVYDAQAGEYAALFDHDGGPGALLSRFIGAVPKGARVLDYGCGTGAAAAHMAAAGLRVDAFDGSAEMVALAQARDGVNAWQSTFDDFEAPDTYHGVWANFSLLHAPRGALPRLLHKIADSLLAQGILHIGMKTGEGEGRDGLGRRYTYVRAAELRRMVEGEGFEIVAQDTGHEVGLAGSDDWWIVLMAQKVADA